MAHYPRSRLWGSPIKKLRPNSSYQKEPCNYLSTILAKLNLRDRTQLAIWSVQTGVTRRDFSKEIQNEIEAKASLFGDRSPCCASVRAWVLLVETATDRTHIGVYAGSSWDVPTSQRSHALDRAIQKFEKSHPHVRVEYENGIPQSDYSDWLSEKIVSGKTPDVFMVSEQDLSLLAARGC